jgi:diguanylate cyclase (GGDEF)-like protein
LSFWRSDDGMLLPNELNESWPAQQLAEFLAVLSVHSDPAAATRSGIERVAEALDAEVAAVVRGGHESVSIGFPAGETPDDQLRHLVERDCGYCELPHLGRCAFVREPLDEEELTWLVVARVDRELTGEERDLLRGMARVLGLVREMVGRRLLLERVSAIQRQIVRRSPADDVVSAIVAGAAEVTSSEIAVMRRTDPAESPQTLIVASHGLDDELLQKIRIGQLGQGVSGHAAQQDRLVVVEDYAQSPLANPGLSSSLEAAMAAPVREMQSVVGSLLVASRAPGRRYSAAERAALTTFAEHASMALTDAHIVEDALHQAMHDPLTGLPNRTLFCERLNEAQQRTSGTAESTAVLFLDIDRFKTVNDSLGHALGDELLVAAAGRLRACLRPTDTAARLGGDEFAVIADGDESVGRRIADRILRAFEEPFALGDRRAHLGASIGITVVDSPGTDVLRDADLAMYHAKARGRGRHELFRPAMRTIAQERLELESELRGASKRGELMLEYQPIVELRGARIRIVEALVRWLHPVRGRLRPDVFIALAEETGEMAELGCWVIRQACEQAADWRGQGLGQDVLVAVNVSPVQLYATDVVADVRAALEDTELNPQRLILELTETVIMDDVQTAIQRLCELKELGVGLAIDDFGTGYCSLQYLRHFPIDYLKIARNFVSDLDGSADDPSLTRGIIDLGSSFGLTLIAEGIERPHQRERLLELGCELGQGYLFSRPQPSGPIEAMLAAQSLTTAVDGRR